MAQKYPKPFLKPRVLRKLEESEWTVEAEWPDGTIEQVGRFATEPQAQDWIAQKSDAWRQARAKPGS